MAIEDELIAKYAKIAEGIYEHRTAGDFTWYGVLGDFLRAVDKGRNATVKYYVQCRDATHDWEDSEGPYNDCQSAETEMRFRQRLFTDLEYRVQERVDTPNTN
jgi:hypothetical protein